MNCLEFLDRLDDLAAGTCPASEREEAERHAAGCQACAELLHDVRVMRHARTGDVSFDLAEGDADSLVADVLRRTSGSACRRAEEVLCDLSFAPGGGDGAAAHSIALSDPLLAEHLEHCAACAALVAPLQLAAAVLPTLADLDPGPGFATAVFAATSRAPSATGAAARLAAWWRAWMARPRFAFELAYVATLVLVLVAGNPAAPLQAASARTATATAALERARTVLPEVLPSVQVPPGVRALYSLAGEALGRQSNVGQVLDAVLQRTTQFWASAWSWLDSTTSGLVAQAKTIWMRLMTPEAKTPPAEPRTPARR